MKDPLTIQPMGWYWDRPESTPQRFAYINPAAKTFRQLFISAVRPVIESVKPDAIHLDISGEMLNDGNGLIEGMDYAQGSMALHRELLDAFPSLALGGEGVNELTAPYARFAQRWNMGDLPPHPISDFLFGDHVLTYGWLGTPNPDADPDGYLSFLSRYEAQGVAPTLGLFATDDLGDSHPGTQRLLRQAREWQTHNFRPDWQADWKRCLFRYRGADGSTARIVRHADMARLSVDDRVLYERTRGMNSITSGLYMPGWPAFDDTRLYGLDLQRLYWLDPQPRPRDSVHISYLSEGTRIDYSQLTPDFGIFELSTAEDPDINLVDQAVQAKKGITFDGIDSPLGFGAVAQVSNLLVGGLSRKGIFAHPPFQGRMDGETFVEYETRLPSTSGIELVFVHGLGDSGAGSDGVTFRVTVDGEEVFKEHSSHHSWTEHHVDLSKWSGRSVRLRLIANPGPKHDAVGDHGSWADVRIITHQSGRTSARIVLPAGSSRHFLTSISPSSMDGWTDGSIRQH